MVKDPNNSKAKLPAGKMEDLKMVGERTSAKRAVARGIVTPIIGNQVGDPLNQAYADYGPEGAPGVEAKEALPPDDSSRFADRMSDGLSAKQKVTKDFG